MERLKENKSSIIFVAILVLIVFVVYQFTKTTPDDEEFYKADNSYYHNYAINEVVPVYVNEQHMAKKYLSDYVDLMINHPKEAYKLLTTTSKKKFNSDYKEYEAYISKMLSKKFIKANVSKYAVSSKKDKKYFIIEDIEGNKFKFIEKSIMNYQVELIK